MVQRKSPDKLGVQAVSKSHVKSEKRPTTTQKPSISQTPEIRSKGGPELKKLMKKSRSIKRSDFDCLRLNPMKRGAKSRLDNPPAAPTEALVSMVTPKKSPPQSTVTPHTPLNVKIPETSPNYMKSTSSSIARKERSQVTPQSSKTSCDSTSPARKDLNYSKLSSVSGHKPGRTLTKTPSLRPVRTLTKTYSNKAGRTSMKKNSSVELYTDQNVRRDTCSSTLKDSKFPTYVTLHPGGTESEGTSVMKVCPYTYCSLNGHHHAQLPPLKCFLSSRRRSLKTQKSMRLKSLSSANRKSSLKPKKDIDTGQMVYKQDPAVPDEDPAGSAISHLIKEEGLDFFVEIYAQPREDTTKSTEGNTDDGNDETKKDVSVDSCGPKNTSYSAKNSAETEVENDDERYAESLSDDSSHSATSFEDNIDHDLDFIMEEMDTSVFVPEFVQKEVEDGDYSPYYMQAGTGHGDFSTGDESGESEIDGSIFDASGMDWEEGEVVDAHLNDETYCSIVTSDEHCRVVCLQGTEDTELDDELTFKPEEIVSNCYEEVPAKEEQQVVHGLNEEFDVVDEALEIELSSGISNEESHTSRSLSLQDPLPSDEDVLEKSIAISEEKDDTDMDDLNTIVVSSDAAEYTLEEPTHDLLEDEKSTCIPHANHETLLEEQEVNSFEPEMHHSTVPEDPDVGADVGMCLEAPEEESQIFESVDTETDQGVATSQDHNLSNVHPDPDASAEDGLKEAEDNEDHLEEKGQKIYSSTFSTEISYAEGVNLKSVEDRSSGGVKMEVEDGTGAEKTATVSAGCSPDQEHPVNCSNLYKPNRCKRPTEDFVEPREFNPRGPRFLPLEPELDPETVDLRHQMMDDRKNSEEWMLDYALRRAVSKLGPARKRKVALLVEAFETVIPVPKYEIHLPHTPTGFTHTRFMQACS